MIPLNYTADSRKLIAIPVDLKPPHRDSDMAHIAADSTWLSWLSRLTGSLGGKPSARRDPKLPFATTAANGRDGGGRRCGARAIGGCVVISTQTPGRRRGWAASLHKRGAPGGDQYGAPVVRLGGKTVYSAFSAGAPGAWGFFPQPPRRFPPGPAV